MAVHLVQGCEFLAPGVIQASLERSARQSSTHWLIIHQADNCERKITNNLIDRSNINLDSTSIRDQVRHAAMIQGYDWEPKRYCFHRDR